MAGKANHWKLGFFVVISVCLSIGVLIFLGAKEFNRDVQPVYFYFAQPVDGLAVGGQVKFMGMPIGTVQSIRAASDRKHVEVLADISVSSLERLGLVNKGQHLTQEMLDTSQVIASLNKSLLTGVATIGVDVPPVDEEDEGYTKPPGLSIPTENSELSDLKDMVTETLGKINRLLDNANRAVEGLKTPALSAELRSTLQAFKNVAERVDEKDGILDNANHLIADLEGKLGHLRMKELNAAAEQVLASANNAAVSITGAGDSATQASDQATALMIDVRSDLVVLTRTLSAINRLANMLDTDPSSLIWGRSYQKIPKPEERN